MMRSRAVTIAAFVATALATTGVAAAQTRPAPTPAPGATPPAPAGAPAAPVKAPPPAPGDDDEVDVDALRQEYLKLRDELFESRARAATVASALFSTQITLKLGYTTGRFYNVTRATIRLDGASVYDDDQGAIAADANTRFEGWIAPGRHLVTIRVEAIGKDDDRFVSTTEATFVVQAVAGKDLIVEAKARDGGDIPYQWARKERGSYQLTVEANVRTVARPTDGKAKSAARPPAAKPGVAHAR